MKLVPGSYFIDVVDDNGCIQSTATIYPPALSLSLMPALIRDIFSGDTISCSRRQPPH
ncbi:MAG: hypothetical protein IPL65_14585 [Lewinellaceae bacterium]|nr:hypothetical protein [Lewinellaceae bacterium]